MKRTFLFIPLLIFLLFLSLGTISANDIEDNLTDTPIIEDYSSNDVVELNEVNLEEKESILEETNTVTNNDDSNVLEDNDDSNNIYVSNDGDDSNNGTKNSPIKTLDVAISKNHEAGGGKTIFLSNGNYTTANLNISDKVNIVGQTSDKVILDANFKGYVFTSSANVNIANLTFKNAFNAIINNGNMVIETSSFINNIASVYGGAIDNNGNLVVKKSTFFNNTAKSNGGAIDNSATLTVNDCLFINNSAAMDAGAISSVNDNYDAIATITNSTFINNSAVRNGGAIKAQKSQLFVYNSSFDNNSLEGYYEGSYGGAIYGWTAGVTLYNSSFTNTKILNYGMGGALYIHGGYYSIVSFNASGLTLINNSANYGGACYFDNAEGNLTNSIILNNSGHKNEAIYGPTGSESTNINLNNNWWGNTQSSTGFDTELVGGLTLPTEWLILNLDANTRNLTVEDSVEITIDLTKTQKGNTINFSSNLPTISLKSTNGVINTLSIDLVNGKGSISYTAKLSGTGEVIANLYGVEDSITFDIAPLSNVIYVDVANGNDNSTGIDWNHAVKTLKHALTLEGNMIYIAQGTYEEYGLVISKNISLIGFGEVIIDGKNTNSLFSIPEYDLNVGFKNINFVNGKSTTNGAAIDIENNGKYVRNGSVLVDNCTFKNNNVDAQFGYGGAIYNTEYDLTITNSVFINNSAPFNGALTSAGGNLNVSNSTFINNSANGLANWGGAIRANAGALNVEKSVFINNTASKGSAILVFSSVTKANINYCIFEGFNSAASVIENTASKITIDANYNYFGGNDNPSNILNGNIDATYWTVLTITPAVKEVVEQETTTLNIDFTKYTDGTNTYTLKEAMPTLTITLNGTIGNVNPKTLVCENGIASVNYTAPTSGREVIYIYAPENVGTLNFDVLSMESNIIYVSSSTGDDSNNGTKDNPLKTLSAAINKNHERGGGKTIYLFDGNYEATKLTIEDNAKIIGQSRMAIIDAKYTYAFNIVDATVSIVNATIKNGIDAIINNGKLSIENIVFSNNRIAILNNGDLTVTSSTFSGDNGDISNNGNATIIKSVFMSGKDKNIINIGNLTIDSSKFNENNNEVIYSTNGKLTLTNSIFSDNTASNVVYLENTTVSLNKNTIDKTGIYINSGLIISTLNVVFLDNSTLRLQDNETGILNVTICDDNGNKITGGEITFTLNDETLNTVNVVNGLANTTFANIPEGTYIVSGKYTFGNNLTVKTGILDVYGLHWFIGDVGYSTLAEAVEAAKDGDIIEGLVDTYYPTTPVTITKNITIMPRGNGALIFDGSKLKNNSVQVGDVIENINNVLRIPTQNYNVTLINLTFTNVVNQGFGGAIYNHGHLNVYNCTFVNNAALGDDYYTYPYGGGAIFNYNGHVIVRDSYFEGNIAYMGGAIYSSADKETPASLDINNATFKYNKGLTQDDAGGAIAVAQYTYAVINNTQFIGNTATTKTTAQYTTAGGTGGAIFIRTTIYSLITNSNFVNNTAYYWGGAIKSSGVFELSNCNFTNNIAGAAGGAIHGAFSNVTNCIFDSNRAGLIEMSEEYKRGGAVSSEGNSLITNSVFYNNVGVRGGAVYAGSGLNQFDNCIFENNSAINGGAIYNRWSTLNVTNSIFTNNSADIGGAIAINQSNFNRYVYLYNNTFENNSAKTGDAIYSLNEVYAKTSFDILNSEFINNGIYVNGFFNISYNAFIMENKTIIDVELPDYVSIENNWWGVNNPNWNTILSANLTAPKVYAIVNATLNESGKDQYNLSVNMYWNGTTNQVNISNIPARLAKLNSTSGVFTIEEGKFNNGVFNSTFITGNDKNYIIDVNVDNELLKLELAILKPTSVNVTVNKGDNPIDNIISVVVNPNNATGKVTINVDGKNHVIDLENGRANLTVSNLTLGEHIFNVTYNGDEYYDSSNTVFTFNETFSPIVNLTVVDLEKYFNGTERLVAILKDNLGNPLANKTITFTVNGNKYTRITDNNGSASMAINLGAGVYNITTEFNGTAIYDPKTVNSTVTVKSTVIGQNIVKMYRNGTQYYVLFLDSEGNPLVNTTVKFNINGVMYERQTNESGIARLNINLNPGNYVITNYNPATGEQNSNNITVESLLADNSDLVKYYKNESKYSLKVYGKDGKLAVNQEVTFNINGVFYKRVSDENGTVSLAINLNPGDYVITAEYEGCKVSNKITVKPTLIADDLSMTYKDGSKFNATVLDGEGKPLANQNVTFNVNGIFYNKVSDENGVASLNINLMKGKYIITSMWNEYQTGNEILIK